MERLYIGEYKFDTKVLSDDSSGNNSYNKYIFVTGDSMDPNYIDITSCYNWDNIGLEYFDYVFVRDQIKMFVSAMTFNNLSEIDKEVALTYCASDMTTLITYLMMQGYSQQEAIDIYITKRAVDIRNASLSCEKRIKSSEYIKSIISFLPEEYAVQFLDATRNFSIDYQNIALFGTQYGDYRDGIMDYIEGTGSYVGGGLRNYPTYPGLNIENLIILLHNILVKGEI